MLEPDLVHASLKNQRDARNLFSLNSDEHKSFLVMIIVIFARSIGINS